MPYFDKKSQNGLGKIKLPDMSSFAPAIGKQLSQSAGIGKIEIIKLGNPAATSNSDLLYVASNNSYMYYTTVGDEGAGIGMISTEIVPKVLRVPNKTLLIFRYGSYVACLPAAGIADEIFGESTSPSTPDQTVVTTSQLDFATLQPYIGTMFAVVKGAIYGDTGVADLSTAAMDSSPLDTTSTAINIPSTANKAIGVLVQLDPLTSTLSYKQSTEFAASLSLAQAYLNGLLPLRDANLKRVGYIKLANGVTSLDNGNVWPCPEFFPDVSPANQLTFDASTVLTIASGAVTLTQSWHTIDTESAAASDNLDNLAGGEEGRFYLLQADNNARTVVIRPNAGNIISYDAIPIVLDDNEKAVWVFFDGTNYIIPEGMGLPNDMDDYGIPDGDSRIAMQYSDGTMWHSTGFEIRGQNHYTIPSSTGIANDPRLEVVFDNTTDMQVDVGSAPLAGFILRAYALQNPTSQHKLVLPVGVTFDGTNRAAVFTATTDYLEAMAYSSTRYRIHPSTTGVTYAAS